VAAGQHGERQLGEWQPQHRVQRQKRLCLLPGGVRDRGPEPAGDDLVLCCAGFPGHQQPEHQRHHGVRVAGAVEERCRDVVEDRAGPPLCRRRGHCADRGDHLRRLDGHGQVLRRQLTGRRQAQGLVLQQARGRKVAPPLGERGPGYAGERPGGGLLARLSD